MSAVSRWAAGRPAEPSNQVNLPGATPPGTVPATGSAMPGLAAKDWHPTVVNLLILILLELVAYAVLRYVFRSALGA